jgi:hypothetical protein
MTRKTTAYARKRRQAGRSWGDPQAGLRLLKAACAFSQPEIVSVQTSVRMALQSLRDGSGCEEDFHTIAAAVNIALVRSEGLDAECLARCQTAQAALMRVLDRKAKTGRWGLDGPARDEIHAALDLYEQILELSTPLQMDKTMQAVVQRMKDGHVFLPAEQAANPAKGQPPHGDA